MPDSLDSYRRLLGHTPGREFGPRTLELQQEMSVGSWRAEGFLSARVTLHLGDTTDPRLASKSAPNLASRPSSVFAETA